MDHSKLLSLILIIIDYSKVFDSIILGTMKEILIAYDIQEEVVNRLW